MGLLIPICVGIMLMLTLVSIISGNSFIDAGIDTTVDTEALLNGTTSEFGIPSDTLSFSIDPLQGALVWIIVIVALGVAVGIQVFGSGLSEKSVHLLFMGTFYISLWSILSILAMNLLTSIAVFGSLIYLVITILYAIGCIIQIGGGSG